MDWAVRCDLPCDRSRAAVPRGLTAHRGDEGRDIGLSGAPKDAGRIGRTVILTIHGGWDTV